MAFLSGFGKRKELRYGTVFPDANLTDFPKLFTIAADSDIAAELAGGGGIAVTASDGETPVPFGLYPSSDPTSGDLILRAKFSPLTAATTGDVIGYLYYDSTASTTEDKAGVVSNGYALFMPLEEDPSGGAPQMRDWVTDTLLGTSNGSMTSGDLVAGQVGKGLDFDGTDDYIACGDLSTAEDRSFAYEAILATTQTGADRWFLAEGNSANNVPITGLCIHNGKLRCLFRSAAPGVETIGATTVNDGAKRHLSVSGDGSQARLYVNGVLDGTSDISSQSPALNLSSVGALLRATPSLYTQAIIDEVRISSVARSADWLEYAYVDDFDNADTFSLGPEETDGGGGGFQAAWAAGCNVLIGGCVS